MHFAMHSISAALGVRGGHACLLPKSDYCKGYLINSQISKYTTIILQTKLRNSLRALANFPKHVPPSLLCTLDSTIFLKKITDM